MNTKPLARILLVEDDDAIREMTEEILRSKGYDVEAVSDGELATSLLLSAEPFDLLVTDIGLPGMSGLELAAWIRDTDPNLRVLLLTGYAGRETEDAALLGPTTSLLMKPFNFRELLAAVSSAIAA